MGPPDSAALLAVYIFNESVPKRFQKTGLQIAMELSGYQRISKRELLQACSSQMGIRWSIEAAGLANAACPARRVVT